MWKHGWTKVQTMLEQSTKMAKNAGTNNASEDRLAASDRDGKFAWKRCITDKNCFFLLALLWHASGHQAGAMKK